MLATYVGDNNMCREYIMSKPTKPRVIRLKNHDDQILFQSTQNSVKEALYEALQAGVDLEGLNLSYADLSFANLDDALFENVSFVGANLMGTNLSECHMNRVDFSHANLVGACFAYAKIHKSDFWDTEFGRTDFACAHVTACRFSGPGVFDIDYQSFENHSLSYIYDFERHLKMPISNAAVHIKQSRNKFLITDGMVCINGQIFRTKKHHNQSLQETLQRYMEG